MQGRESDISVSIEAALFKDTYSDPPDLEGTQRKVVKAWLFRGRLSSRDLRMHTPITSSTL